MRIFYSCCLSLLCGLALAISVIVAGVVLTGCDDKPSPQPQPEAGRKSDVSFPACRTFQPPEAFPAPEPFYSPVQERAPGADPGPASPPKPIKKNPSKPRKAAPLGPNLKESFGEFFEVLKDIGKECEKPVREDPEDEKEVIR